MIYYDYVDKEKKKKEMWLNVNSKRDNEISEYLILEEVNGENLNHVRELEWLKEYTSTEGIL